MSRPVLGIDLGTTNSVVASIDNDGRVFVFRNAVGAEMTPSVVYFEAAERAVVGAEAQSLTAMDGDNGVTLIKRAMGTDFPVRVGGQEHTPESLSALILRQLVASTGSNEVPRVVITVPAYFGTAEREATFQAGRIAGLEVLELLDEPVAAAVHYGLSNSSDRTVLVYDLGGGTFDTTVLQIRDGEVTVVATDGHNSLGGADVDRRLLSVVLSRVEGLVPESDYDAFVDDATAIGQLSVDVEVAKRYLSARLACDVVVRTATDRITVPVRREDLEAACADLFDSTTIIVNRLLESAGGNGVTKIDDVIMVGGSSRIPILATRLGALLGTTPRLVEPDLAVAKGAAIRAHQLLTTPQYAALSSHSEASGMTRGRRSGKVTPVTPRAIGILLEDSFDPSGMRSFIEHVVPANAALPLECRLERYGTILDNQDSVRVQVFEQAGPIASPEVEHNRKVLDGELTGLGALPASTVIELTVTIAVDGRLTVVAREPRSGRGLTLEAFVEGVVDSAETSRLTHAVGLIAVRG